MQDGCCGSETPIYSCPCGEEYLEELRTKNRKRQEKQKNVKMSQGEEK